MRKRNGFSLIELMIVVVIIGVLAALAIPRFMRAAKKSKLSERKIVLKSIWVAAKSYYEDHGEYPAYHVFNNASTQNTDWNSYPGVTVDRPSGFPRFTYYMDSIGPDHFIAYAFAYIPDSWDGSMVETNDYYINQDGVMYEDESPYEPE